MEPWGEDKYLKQLYQRHFKQIKDQDVHNRRKRTYLRYLNDNANTLIEVIENAIDRVYCLQTQAFKVNLSFSYILRYRETGEYRFCYASNNERTITQNPKTHSKSRGPY